MNRIIVVVSIVSLAAGGAHAADAAPSPPKNGDLWEVTSQMTMEGMPAGMGMPAQTRRVCTGKEWTKPPVASDEHNCQMTDFKTTATKSSWKVSCQGMNGEGEITRTSPDAYTGWMKMSAPQGTMTMNLTGKRVGDCDSAEAKKEREAQIAHIQAQVAANDKTLADMKRQTCMSPVESLDLKTLNMQAATCDGPEYKAAFCDKLKTDDGVKLTCKREKSDPESGLIALAQFCGADAAALKTPVCGKAQAAEDFETLGACCPDQARALAAQRCAGRTYTSLIGNKYQSFCSMYARDLLDQGKVSPPKSPTPH